MCILLLSLALRNANCLFPPTLLAFRVVCTSGWEGHFLTISATLISLVVLDHLSVHPQKCLQSNMSVAGCVDL